MPQRLWCQDKRQSILKGTVVGERIGEGIFGALTKNFGDRLKTKLREAREARVLIRCLIYANFCLSSERVRKGMGVISTAVITHPQKQPNLNIRPTHYASPMEKWDVAIVGAGPAGLSAAVHAAMEGVSVIVLDRKKAIGLPVRCGEGSFYEIMEELNIGRGFVVEKLDTFRFILPNGDVIEVRSPIESMSIDRSILEKELAMKAARYGTVISVASTVLSVKNNCVHLANGEVVRAKVIIIADGVESRIGRSLGLNTHLLPKDLGVCAQYTVANADIDRGSAEIYLGNRIAPRGYVWVVSRGDEAHIGILVSGEYGHMARKLLDDFIGRKFSSARAIKYITGCVPQSLPVENFALKNVLFAGDAARFSGALGGGGIHNALLSGKYAGICAGRSILRNKIEDAQMYRKLWKKHYIALLRGYRMKERLFGGDDSTIVRFFSRARPVLHLLKYRFFGNLALKLWLGDFSSQHRRGV
ncbi:MAG: hypothetical protein DRN20_04015 [Thermoplasmata archaeon]|nr:MAG: hypothetical protein DRN20_04015 [Thermoplasmata archaeon]